jgi:hypothetical protein
MTKKHSSAKENYEFVSGQHGGYWRHDFIDHNYLYNLYYPPEDFFSHIANHIHQLVLSYPVGQKELAGLVGNLIDQPAERLVVGNGAAELIKIIATLGRKLIVPVPSFNEYANAMPEGQVVEFALEAPTFQLDVDKFAHQTGQLFLANGVAQDQLMDMVVKMTEEIFRWKVEIIKIVVINEIMAPIAAMLSGYKFVVLLSGGVFFCHFSVSLKD